MIKSKSLFIGMILALVAWAGVSTASAQDGDQPSGPSITVTPTSVDAAGEHTFTVTGTGWEVATDVNVIPCDVPASGDVEDITTPNCTKYVGMAALNVPFPGGSFTVDVSVNVPEGGIVISAGEAACVADRQSCKADAVIITVGMPDGTGDMNEDRMGDELANTGLNTSLLVVIGMGMALAGVMVLGLSRRLRTL
ncbi:hypothetical protein [Candidatus Poriferisocius sp.]|uniref:hypothetical protein n=1 Tax=Candidatus Poriferisocius sp. TaxID=3101276 RepID=UPI003B011DB9